MVNRILRVLIVDDEPIARQVLAEELESLPGVEIAGAAATGTEALVKISTLNPDLVFLDLQMPVMGGAAVIKSLPSSIPRPLVVVLTAFDEREQYGQEARVIDHINKPVTPLRLEQAIGRARLLMTS